MGVVCDMKISILFSLNLKPGKMESIDRLQMQNIQANTESTVDCFTFSTWMTTRSSFGANWCVNTTNKAVDNWNVVISICLSHSYARRMSYNIVTVSSNVWRRLVRTQTFLCGKIHSKTLVSVHLMNSIRIRRERYTGSTYNVDCMNDSSRKRCVYNAIIDIGFRRKEKCRYMCL